MKDQQINKRNKKQKAHKNKFTNRQENMSKKLKMKATEPGVVSRGKDMLKVEARNEGQRQILQSIQKNTITIVDGKAGTGKSHIAIMYGLNELLKGTYNKLIIARPCVESFGQNLGFLPGSADQKVSVYFEHLFNILQKQINIELVKRAISNGQIQIIPLAYMRGRNFEDAFVLVDEVQNTIPQQFRLIVTRLSQGSKMILCGDSNQSDRCDLLGNGLADAIRKFKNVDGIGIVELGNKYIVRSKIVKIIEDIYDKDEQLKRGNNQKVIKKKVSEEKIETEKGLSFDQRFNNDADLR